MNQDGPESEPEPEITPAIQKFLDDFEKSCNGKYRNDPLFMLVFARHDERGKEVEDYLTYKLKQAIDEDKRKVSSFERRYREEGMEPPYIKSTVITQTDESQA